MLTIPEAYKTAITSPVRRVTAKLHVLGDSSLAATYTQDDALKSIEVQRIGDESKFFGFGVVKRLNFKLIDIGRVIDLSNSSNLQPQLFFNGNLLVSLGAFHYSEAHRDENTNELSVTAYDKLYNLADHTVSELELTHPSTMYDYVVAITKLLGFSGYNQAPLFYNCTQEEFQVLSYSEGANFDGTETLRTVMDMIAEATQTIYFMRGNQIMFTRPIIAGAPVLTISREDYITLDSGANRRLAKITHASELGDNWSAQITESGTTQVMRDNAFWNMRDNISDLVQEAIDRVGGMTVNQFECTWRGNPALEPGDRIALMTKDGNLVYSYVINDTITYNGSLSQKTSWQYSNTEETVAATTVGQAINQTFAKVDKVHNRVEIVASNIDVLGTQISNLYVNADNINASVSNLRESVENQQSDLEEELESIRNEVSATMTSEEIKILVSEEVQQNGSGKVTTSTGFTFNEDGLTINRSGSEMTTTITEDGMAVYRNYEQVLTADNEGVKAEDLHATTYLIIGKNSRFEDFTRSGKKRTACFWIGG